MSKNIKYYLELIKEFFREYSNKELFGLRMIKSLELYKILIIIKNELSWK